MNDEHNLSMNEHSFPKDYQPGQEILKLVYKPGKFKQHAQGPYEIIAVHTNCMKAIQLNAHPI
jgi:hypothetical protein